MPPKRINNVGTFQRLGKTMPRSSDQDRHDPHEAPITVNTVVKWTGIIFSDVSAVVSIVWFAALIKGDIITLQQENIALKREIEIRNTSQDKEIEKLKDHADVTDKTMADMGRKLDVAVTLLQRIDEKVGKP